MTYTYYSLNHTMGHTVNQKVCSSHQIKGESLIYTPNRFGVKYMPKSV